MRHGEMRYLDICHGCFAITFYGNGNWPQGEESNKIQYIFFGGGDSERGTTGMQNSPPVSFFRVIHKNLPSSCRLSFMLCENQSGFLSFNSRSHRKIYFQHMDG